MLGYCIICVIAISATVRLCCLKSQVTVLSGMQELQIRKRNTGPVTRRWMLRLQLRMKSSLPIASPSLMRPWIRVRVQNVKLQYRINTRETGSISHDILWEMEKFMIERCKMSEWCYGHLQHFNSSSIRLEF